MLLVYELHFDVASDFTEGSVSLGGCLVRVQGIGIIEISKIFRRQVVFISLK